MNQQYLSIYNFYTRHFIKTGNYPTLEQIGNHLGGLTRERARQIMNEMEEEGYIFQPKRSKKVWGFRISNFIE